MRTFLTAACVAVIAAFAAPAFAGYTATTGVDLGTNTDPGNDGATVGDSFTIQGGTFTSFIPDGPSDPQLTGADLAFYRYNLTATVANVGPGAQADYTGTYEIFYDLNLNGMNDDGLLVSGGTLAATASFFAPNNATFTGQLFQTTGPSNPAFADLSYGGNPVDFTGDYVGLGFGDGSQATFQSTLRQDGGIDAVPEPATFSLLAMGIPMLMMRRRRTA